METLYAISLTAIICVIIFLILFKKNERFRLNLELFGKEPYEIVDFVQERGPGKFDFHTLNWIFKKILRKLHTIDPDSAVACVDWHVSQSLKNKLFIHLIKNRGCVDCLMKNGMLISVSNQIHIFTDKDKLWEILAGNLLEIAISGPQYSSINQILNALELFVCGRFEFPVLFRKIVAMILLPYFADQLEKDTWDCIHDIFSRNEGVSKMLETFCSVEPYPLSSS